jgi:hypothetical protein
MPRLEERASPLRTTSFEVQTLDYCLKSPKATVLKETTFPLLEPQNEPVVMNGWLFLVSGVLYFG